MRPTPLEPWRLRWDHEQAAMRWTRSVKELKVADVVLGAFPGKTIYWATRSVRGPIVRR